MSPDQRGSLQEIVRAADLRRAVLPLAGNLPAVLGGRPIAQAPVYLTWALTMRCNLGCLHCSLGPATPEMTPAQRIETAARIGESKVWGVSLIGGEPTLIADLATLAASLTRKHKYVSIGTSGFRLGRHLPGLIDAGVDTIIFSMDHHDAAAHDAFRGRPGLFEEASALIEELRALPGKRPRVQVRCTIHRENFEELDEIIEHWRARCDNLILQIIQDGGIHKVRDERVLFRPEDRPRVTAVLASVQERYPELRSRYFQHMADYLFAPETLRSNLGYRCLVVPGTSAVVMPNGALRLCYGHPESEIGNILHGDLHRIWRSEATCTARAHLQSPKLGCMCWEQVNSPNLDVLPWAARFHRILKEPARAGSGRAGPEAQPG